MEYIYMDIIDKCRNQYGALSVANKLLLNSLLTQPSIDIWEKARWIVIWPTPILTLDTAVQRLPYKLAERTPSPFTLYRALKFATEQHALAAHKSRHNKI